MVTVKVFGKKKKKDLQNNYKNKDALENVIHYINRENEGGKEELVAELCGGYGVDMSSSETIIRDMRRIKTIYGKEEGRQLRHFSVNLTADETEKIRDLRAFAYDICENYGNEYQTVFAAHRKMEKGRERIHFHVCCNSVSYVTGRKISEPKGELWEFKRFINEKVKEHMGEE